MQPFDVCFRAGRRGLWLGWLLHALSAAVLPFLHGWQLYLTAVFLPFSVVYAWRVQSLRHRNAVLLLQVDTQGRARLVLRDGRILAARLRPGSLIHRSGCLLHWQTESGVVRQSVWPDMTDGESYRRLYVWARFLMPNS